MSGEHEYLGIHDKYPLPSPVREGLSPGSWFASSAMLIKQVPPGESIVCTDDPYGYVYDPSFQVEGNRYFKVKDSCGWSWQISTEGNVE